MRCERASLPAIVALSLLATAAALSVADVPATASPGPLSFYKRYERTQTWAERATAVDPSGLVAWFAPGVGAEVGRQWDPWTRAGVWDLQAGTAWELALPPVAGSLVDMPLPTDVDAAGNVAGTVIVHGGPDPGRWPVRWGSDGTPTLLDRPGGSRPVPVHVHGAVVVGSAQEDGWGALRWDGTVASPLPTLVGTTRCRAMRGAGPQVLGSCWTPELSGATAVAWDLDLGTVAPLSWAGPMAAPEAVLDVLADGRSLVRPAGSTAAATLPSGGVLSEGWSTFGPSAGGPPSAVGSGALLPDDVVGDRVATTVGWWYGECPCQSAVHDGYGFVSWLDPDTSNGETSVEVVGALADGTVVAVGVRASVRDGYGPYVEHRATATYRRVPRTPFPDVAPGHPFFDEVERGHELGYVRGYPDGTFRPGDQVSRQAFVAFLVRARAERWGFAAPPPCTTAPFPDVGVDHPFCAEITRASAQGWVTGYGDGLFRPGAPVTRQAIVAIAERASLWGASGSCGARFFDVGADHPFCAAITWAADTGVAEGYVDGTFRPGATSSRQATVAMLERAMAIDDLSAAAGWSTGP